MDVECIYRRCMVLAGGGSQLGVYLGMHAALREHGAVPDLLLATCGGAMAAAIIQRLPDPQDQRVWLSSPEMHRWWSLAVPTRNATATRLLGSLTLRWLDWRQAPRVVDFYAEHLFRFPEAPFLPPQSAGTSHALAGPDVVFIGACWRAPLAQRGRARRGQAVLQQVLFGPERLRALLGDARAPCGQWAWPRSAVMDSLDFVHDAPLEVAAAISMRDVYYFAPMHWGGHEYMGGMVDLFPIEIARRLASEVVMEFKAPFEQFTAVPGWRATLGVDANRRLHQAHAQDAEIRIDCTDIRTSLSSRLYCRRWQGLGRLTVEVAPDLSGHRRAVDAQWAYGYHRAREALQRVRGRFSQRADL